MCRHEYVEALTGDAVEDEKSCMRRIEWLEDPRDLRSALHGAKAISGSPILVESR
jgi:hypothetical protein